ncbi:MAG: DUF1573 domain-containing protein [Taibaiella sp.]|nr:DUF1573 domain-containing protein [Taibaiella sp.]
MRRYLIIISLLALTACNSSTEQNKQTDSKLLPTNLVDNPYTANGLDTAAMKAKPTMDFKDTLHDFGSIHEGETVEYDFEYKNNGKNPLVITSAAGSCGCTIADYAHEPVAPGKGGLMKVKFNSASKPGHQEKTVTIITNSNKGTQMLFIKAEVIKK